MQPKELEPAMVSQILGMGYTGEAVLSAVTVTDGEMSLQEGRDYQLSYSDNLNIRTGSVHVSGIGNYTGTVTRSFSIKVAQKTFTLADPGDKIYGDGPFSLKVCGGSGEGETVFRVLGDEGVFHLNGSLVTIIGAGTVRVTAVKCEDDIYAEASDSCEITVAARKLDAEGVKLAGAGQSYTYTGVALKPVTVTDSGAVITPDDYDIFIRIIRTQGKRA